MTVFILVITLSNQYTNNIYVSKLVSCEKRSNVTNNDGIFILSKQTNMKMKFLFDYISIADSTLWFSHVPPVIR